MTRRKTVLSHVVDAHERGGRFGEDGLADSTTTTRPTVEISDEKIDAVRKEFWNETLGEGWHYDTLSMIVEIAHLRARLQTLRPRCLTTTGRRANL